MTTPESFQLDESVGFLVSRAALTLRNELSRAFKVRGYDVTAEQFGVLVYLSEQDSPPTQTELAADLPLPGGPIPTPFGALHTSILSPGPNFAALDGLGAFGPPDPAAIAAPEYLQLIAMPNGPPMAVTVVLQVYAYEASLPYPQNILVSPPRQLVF